MAAVEKNDLGPPEPHGARELAQHAGGDLEGPALRGAQKRDAVEGAHEPQVMIAARGLERRPPPTHASLRVFASSQGLFHRQTAKLLWCDLRSTHSGHRKCPCQLDSRAIRANTAAMRPAARPSQSGIGRGRRARARRILRAAATIARVSLPTSTFVPRVVV